jgi:hypothetical protein
MTSKQFVPARPRGHGPGNVEPFPQERDGAEGLIEDIDELLDEIDAVLEDQAVLVHYRQRSGQ